MISLDLGLWRRSGGTGFNPLTLSPALWLDASDSATLFQSNGGSAAAADGDPVGYWTDKSGNAKHASQTDGTKKPLLKLSQQNSKNGILADGVNDVLTTSLILNAKPGLTWFMVGQPVGSGANSSARVNGYNTNGGVVLLQTRTIAYFEGRPAAGAYTNCNSSFTASNATFLLCGTYSGTQLTIRKNGSTLQTANPATTGNTVSTTALSLFGETISPAYDNGQIYEVLIFDTFLSITNIANVTNYLNAKWGVY
jgi:hypothetical protein